MTPPTDRHDEYADGVPAEHGELHNEDTAHEHSDVNVRAVVYFLVGLTVVAIVAGIAMWGVFVILEGQAAKNDPALSPLAAPAGQLPPEPRLLTDEPAVLEKQRAQERELLEKGEWVDKGAGVARIPIEEAKKLLLEKGLPVRSGEPIDPRLGTRVPSMSDASSGRNAVVKEPAASTGSEGVKPETPKTEQKPGGGH